MGQKFAVGNFSADIFNSVYGLKLWLRLDLAEINELAVIEYKYLKV